MCFDWLFLKMDNKCLVRFLAIALAMSAINCQGIRNGTIHLVTSSSSVVLKNSSAGDNKITKSRIDENTISHSSPSVVDNETVPKKIVSSQGYQLEMIEDDSSEDLSSEDAYISIDDGNSNGSIQIISERQQGYPHDINSPQNAEQYHHYQQQQTDSLHKAYYPAREQEVNSESDSESKLVHKSSIPPHSNGDKTEKAYALVSVAEPSSYLHPPPHQHIHLQHEQRLYRDHDDDDIKGYAAGYGHGFHHHQQKLKAKLKL